MPKTPKVFTHRVVLYLTDADAVDLELAARQAGLSGSAYVRNLIRNDVERRSGGVQQAPAAPV